MAKRYTVKHTITLGTPSDPNDLAWNEWIDLPVLLSQRLQKNIRQGRVINIHGIQAHLSAPNSGNLDLGGAISGKVRWAPATKNSAKAWRHLFGVWRKQKAQIVNGIGPQVRYDDFEVAYNISDISPRTSTLLTTGLLDTTPESVTIYGNSSDGTNVSLSDTFSSGQQLASPSRFPLSNNIVKESKYTLEFPAARTHPISASWSTIDAQSGHDSGAQIQSEYSMVRDGASLCGRLITYGQLLPENVIDSIQDELILELYITCSIGAPLVKASSKPRYRRPKRKTASKKKKTYRRK